MKKGKTISELHVGDSASMEKLVTDADIRMFAELSGDDNPVHVDEEFAKTTIFGRRIAHGMFGAALISAVLGTKLPGYGCIYMSQDVRFMKPVFLGDAITATATVKELIVEKNRVILDTTVTNQNGDVVITGSAMLMPTK